MTRTAPRVPRFAWAILAVAALILPLCLGSTHTARAATPQVVQLASPTDKQTGVARPVVFTWDLVTGATGYTIEISRGTDFTRPFLVYTNSSPILGTTTTVSVLAPNTTYYWHVLPNGFSKNNADWSAIWSFTTAAPSAGTAPAAPALKSPADAAVVNGTDLYVTAPTVTPIAYWYQVALDAGFTDLVTDDEVTDASVRPTNPTDTSRRLIGFGPAPRTTYWWRVKAWNDAGESPWSLVRTFVGNEHEPPTPTIIYPVKDSYGVERPVKLEWGTSLGADYYFVQVFSDAGTTLLWENPQVTATTAEIPDNLLTVGLSYWWRVTAILVRAGGGTYASYSWSALTKFTVQGATPPVPQLRQPANTSQYIDPPVGFLWSGVTSATGYELQYSTSDTFAAAETQTVVVNTNTNTTTVNSLLADTRYYWKVRTERAGDYSEWSTVFYFRTNVGKPEIPLASVNVPGRACPFFAGQPDGLVGPSGDTTPTHAPVLVAVPLGTPALRFNASGQTTHVGQVAACGPGGYPALTAATDKTYEAYGLAAPSITLGSLVGVFLTDAAPEPANMPPGLTRITGRPALQQIFQIGAGPIVIQVPAGATRLFLGTLDGGMWSDNTGDYVVDIATNSLAAPRLTAPVDGGGTNLPATFGWQSVPGATQYQVQVSTAQYQWGTPVYDQSVGGATQQQVPAGTLTAGTLYWWRVRAFTGSTSGPWSEAWSFTGMSLTAPTLVSPANNGSSALPATFQWQAVPGAAGYRIMFDESPMGFNGTTHKYDVAGGSTTSYTLTDGLQMGDWYWIVVPLDAQGNEGPASATWRFALRSTGVVVFTTTRGGNASISIMNLDGSNVTNLTDVGSRDEYATISPKGDKIAFASRRTGNWEIYTMNTDGTGLKQVTNDGPTPPADSDDVDPMFTGDGTKIVFVRGDYSSQSSMNLWVVNAGGGTATQLTTTGGFLSPDVSNDNTTVVFVKLEGGTGRNIYKMPLTGGTQTPLTTGTATVGYPSFSPDGTKIVYYSDGGSVRHIWIMGADGSGKTQLTTAGSIIDQGPCFSPWGDKIIFTREPQGANNKDIWIMDLDGKNQAPLTTDAKHDYDPDCAPGQVNNPPPDPPTPLSPTKGATAVPAPVTFTWTPAPGATSYILEIGTDALFDTTIAGIPEIMGGATDTTTVSNLQMNKQYWWHLRAKNSDGNSVWSETFTFTTEAERVIADLLGGLDATTPTGDNVYEKPVATQIVTDTVDPAQTATYYLRLENDGNTAQPVKLRRDPSSATWDVKVFVEATNTEITGLVTTGTWTSPQSVAPGDSVLFRVEITPDAAAQPGASQSVSFFGYIQNGEVARSPQDHLQFDALVALRKIDAEISPTDASNYVGADTYNGDGQNQSAALMTPVGTAAAYYVRVTNQGNGPDSAVVTIPAPPTGWTLQVLDEQDADVTAEFAPSMSVALAAGAGAVFRVRLTPGASATASPIDTLVTATSAGNPNVLDAVLATTTIKTFGVDLQAKAAGPYVGSGIINATGAGQTVAADASPLAKAVYRILLANTGNDTDRFLVKGPKSAGGWTVAYFSAGTGGTDITAAVTEGGWTSPELQPDGGTTIRVEVQPDATVNGGSVLSALVSAASVSSPAKLDAVRLDTTVIFARGVDLQIKTTGAYLGSGIINPTGAEQTQTATTTAGLMVEYTIIATNTGNAADRVLLTLPATPAGWTLAALDSQGASITSALQGAGWSVDLARGASATIRVRVTPTASAIGGTTADVLVTGVSAADAAALDAVLACTSLPRIVKADLHVKSTTNYVGDNVYNATGANQSASRSASGGAMVSYTAKLQNDGNAADSIVLKAGAGLAAWQVRYFDTATGGNDITGEVTGANGWTSPALAPGEAAEVRIELTPDVALNGTDACALVITGASAFTSTVTDTVKATTTIAAVRRPDLLVRTFGESTDAGNGVYTTTAAGQTKLQTVGKGVLSQFVITLQNDGNLQDTFKLTGAKTTTAWTIRYVDLGNAGADITSYVTGTGWSTTLARGASRQVRVDVTPGATAPLDVQFPITVTAALVNAATVQDVGKLVTTRSIIRQVDLMVRNLEESAFAGDNIFNTTGENQSRMQQGGAGKKFTYLLRIQNDSDGTDTLLVKQDATSVASLGWTVKYYDSPTGGYDITGMITSAAGWVLAARQPGSVRDIRVEVTANTTVPADAMANLLLTVSSLGDPAKVDAVLCTAKKLKLTSVSFIVSPAGSASPGMPVTLVATAVGGNTVEYRFAVRHKDPNTGGQVWDNAYTRMFSVKNTVTWTFSAPQTYTFVVYARELGTTGAEQYAITSIQSYGITSVP